MVLGPAYTHGEIEAPAGERNMGSYTIAIYTEEQQKRLGVDENGETPPEIIECDFGRVLEPEVVLLLPPELEADLQNLERVHSATTTRTKKADVLVNGLQYIQGYLPGGGDILVVSLTQFTPMTAGIIATSTVVADLNN